MKKTYCVICSKHWKFKSPKILYILKKNYFFLLFALSAKMKMGKYLEKKNQLGYLKESKQGIIS